MLFSRQDIVLHLLTLYHNADLIQFVNYSLRELLSFSFKLGIEINILLTRYYNVAFATTTIFIEK